MKNKTKHKDHLVDGGYRLSEKASSGRVSLRRRVSLRHSLNHEFAWLSPDGNLYGCEYGYHLKLAMEIVGKYYPEAEKEAEPWPVNHEHYLEQKGWLKQTDGYPLGYGWWPEDAKITQAQLNTIFDWCKKHKAFVPKWVLKAEVD